MDKRLWQLGMIVIAGVLLISAPAMAVVSNTIPLDSWVYPALDKLSGMGLVDSALQGSRPYTRLEAARQVREAAGKAESMAPLPVVQQLLEKLQYFLSDELGDSGPSETGYLKPLREVRLDYLFQKGQDSAIVGTNAKQFGLNYNNFGIDYSEHHNGQLIFQSEARLSSFFLLSVRPIVGFEQGDDGSEYARLLHAKAALGLGPLEVSVGRQSLWWGQGRHGSLILTNNAKPLDMVRITNPSPVLLPWILKYLGPFRFDAFWSELEKDRVISEPYFAGLRLQFKPLPWFEIGASRTVMFGGEGVPNISWDEFITILGGKNLEGGEDTSNSVAALDGCIRLPFLWGAELYGEYGGEDEAGQFLANNAWLAGIYLPFLEPTGRLSLRIEYADLSKIDDNSPPWYRHRVFHSGYTYEGKILGHHVGGAAKDMYGELQVILPHGMLLTLGLDYEKRGLDQSVQEKHYQGTLDIDWSFADHYSIKLGVGYDRIKNADFVDGNDRNDYLASLGLRANW